MKIKMFKKKIKICPLKTTLVADILKNRFSFLPKPFSKRALIVGESFFLKRSSKKLAKVKEIGKKIKICKDKKKLSLKHNRGRSFKKLYKRFKKIFGCKRYNKRKLRLPIECASNLFYFKLTILIKKNNIFCNFSDFKNNKTFNSCSSGKYKIKVSKKTLKYTHDLVLEKFYKEIWQKVYIKIKKKEKKTKKVLRKGVFVNVVCSTKLRKKVCQFVRRKFKKIPLIINALSKKVFNGCRPPKKVRKKRRGMRIYK